MNADGSHPVNLSNHPGNDSAPTWGTVSAAAEVSGRRDDVSRTIGSAFASQSPKEAMIRSTTRGTDPAWRRSWARQSYSVSHAFPL